MQGGVSVRPNVERVVRRYYDRLRTDEHHRYRSWEHCYRHFRRRASLRGQHDLRGSALQLGFYLASWGMYRGSGFLLQKDFHVHRKVVRELLRPKYDWLLGYRPISMESSIRAIRDILALVEAIRAAYDGHFRRPDGRRRKIYVSDTLATKIILGAIACVPAYDSLVVEGLRLEGIPYSAMNQYTLKALFEWYFDHADEFRSTQKRIQKDGLSGRP